MKIEIYIYIFLDPKQTVLSVQQLIKFWILPTIITPYASFTVRAAPDNFTVFPALNCLCPVWLLFL